MRYKEMVYSNRGLGSSPLIKAFVARASEFDDDEARDRKQRK